MYIGTYLFQCTLEHIVICYDVTHHGSTTVRVQTIHSAAHCYSSSWHIAKSKSNIPILAREAQKDCLQNHFNVRGLITTCNLIGS